VSLDGLDGPISGLGVPEGLTLIVGGGFHGKSTVLQAIQRGFLDHIPGDGREQVVSRGDVVKVRAEDGRCVQAVDVSAFLRELPGGRQTAPFSTEDASGSTSQAAAIIEAIESGASVLLLDEDTSATNLLVRDERMRQLIPQQHEPITPFVERVRELYERWGVSTVMVLGGVGDYLAVSDTVIGMVGYRPRDLTAQAQALSGEAAQPPTPLSEPPAPRPVLLSSLALTGKGRVRARDQRRVDYGRAEIDLSAVEQVLDAAHAESLGHSLGWLSVTQEGALPLSALLDILEDALDQHGVEALSPFREPSGRLIRPRRHEVAAALSRLRSFRTLAD
jgi:predicted ABC-class ATPase